MSNNFFAKAAFVAATVATGFVAVSPAQAAIITRTAASTIPSSFTAVPAGTTVASTFSYDNATVSSSIGFQSIPLLSLAVNFSNGISYTLADSLGTTTADFFSGVFDGIAFEAADASLNGATPLLSYVINRTDSAISDFTGASANAPVAYGFPPTNPIPTPALLPGLVGLGLAAARKRAA
jgi:hypothetical protein